MTAVTYSIRLDARKGGSQAMVRLPKGEQLARQLQITLTNGSGVIKLGDGYRAAIRALKPDDTIVYDNCEIFGNTVLYTIPSALMVVPNRTECELQVYNDEGLNLFSPRFDIFVETPLFAEGQIESTNEYTALVTAHMRLSQLEKTEEDREEAEQERKDAEELRVDAENLRKQAEAQRVTAESIRNAAEDERERSEDIRNAGFNEAVSSANTATQSANTAATNANAAAESVKSSTAEGKNVIDEAAEAALADINADTATGLTQIQQASAAAQEDVTAQGELVKASIPADYTALFASVNKIEDDYAPAIVESVKGKVVVVEDSAERRLKGLRVFGRTEQVTTTGAQLIPFPYRYMEYTSGGVKFVAAEDGRVTATGTATTVVYYSLYGGYAANQVPIPDWLVPGKTYCMSSAVQIYLYKASGEARTFSDQSFVFPEGYDYIGIFIRISSGATVADTYSPMLNEGDTALPYEPYTGGAPSPSPDYPQALNSVGDDGAVEVTAAGKNLLPFPYALGGAGTVVESNGGKITCLDDGSLAISGTPTGHIGFRLYRGDLIIKGKQTWCLRGDYSNFSATVFLYTDATLSTEITRFSVRDTPVRFDTNDYPTANYMIVETSREQSNVAMSGTAYPMLVAGDSIPTAYEPYKPTTPVTLSTPNGLPGIPVDSDGNYTDADGQQWACDEVDLERGVYVQRVYEHEVTFMSLETKYNNRASAMLPHSKLGGFTERNALCTHFAYNESVYYDRNDEIGFACNGFTLWCRFGSQSSINTQEKAQAWLADQYAAGTPVTVQYVLATPIETPLSASEIAAYKAMLSRKPTTTIYNDAGAHMAVDYVADTKTWINNKIAALSSAIINNA